MVTNYKECIVCGNQDSKPVFEAQDFRLNTVENIFTLVQCTTCGLIYINPQPAEEELSKFYPKNYYHPIPSFIETFYTPITNLVFKRMIAEIRRYKSQGKCLDIGCGSGVFMNYLSASFDVYGADLSDNTGGALKSQLKDRVRIGHLKSCDFQNKEFDLIIMKQVLEHFANPIENLAEIHRILKDDGLLYIEVPNLNCLEARWFGKYWYNLEVPRHLYQFRLEILLKLLENNRFQPVTILDGWGIIVFRTPLALVNSFRYYLDKHLSIGNGLNSIIFLTGFLPALLISLGYRSFAPPERQTDLRVIFKKA